MDAMFNRQILVIAAVALAVPLIAAQPAAADNPTPYAGTRVIETAFSFTTLWSRIKQAIQDNELGIVAQACASCGAKARGVSIPGNGVVMVYRNDFAVRTLEASVAAGIEAPLRFYLTENADGTATLTYRTPSATFAPYGSAELDELARELNAILEKIVHDTLSE